MEELSRRSSDGLTGFVLAGGLSSRLGQDKVLLPWHGRTLLEHSIERLQQVCGTVRVCADRKDLDRYLPESGALMRDALPGAGPLTGIVAGLEHSQTSWNFFLAVDTPLVPAELLQALVSYAENNSSGVLCIVPQVNGLPQPLCGLYHQSLTEGLCSALKAGKYKVMLALREAVLSAGVSQGPALGTPGSRVELFDADAFAAAAMPNSKVSVEDWFLNINTPQDWQRANDLSPA